MGKLDIKTQVNKLKLALVFLFILHLFLLFNLKFTAWPEMQLWPYLVLKGWLPYRDIAIAHTPALILELSLFKLIFGTGLLQLKVYTWLVIIFTDLALFIIAKRLWGIRVAVASVFFYIFVQAFYEGNGLWFDLALGLYAIGLYYLMRKKYFLMAGMLWAFSFLTKQTAVWFLFPIVIMCLQGVSLQAQKSLISKIKLFVLGVLVVFLPTLLLLYLFGIWPNFWFWVVEFGIGILPRAQGQISFPELRELLIALLPFSILSFLLFTPKKKKGYQLIFWTVFSALGAYPRWGLFHFQPALPFLAISVSLVLLNLKKLTPILKYAFGGYLLLTLFLFSNFYLREWGQGTRFYEKKILDTANYIRNNTDKGESIFVVNTWDSLYSMTGTLPATKPWIPHLPWYMELSGVQEEIVKDLDSEKPETIVVREYTDSGLSSYRPGLIDRFLTENYQISDKIGEHLILLPK